MRVLELLFGGNMIEGTIKTFLWIAAASVFFGLLAG